jgi:S1-C subfamily serine protease
MRFWKAGAAAAVMMGAAATQLSGAESPTQVRIDRDVREPFEHAVQVLSAGGGSRIGATIADVTASDVAEKKLASESGVLVTGVDSDSPASKAGLKEGDVIVEFDGERTRSVSQLRRLIQETPSGRKIAMSVSRGGQRMPLTIEPESGASALDRFEFTPRFDATPRPPRAPRAPRAPQAVPFRTPMPDVRVPLRAPQFELFRDGFAYSLNGGRLGVTTQTLSDQLAKHFGVERGVLVTEVTEDSAASKAGLRAGDIITKVGSTAVDDSGDVLRALGAASGEVTIEVVRDRKAQTLKATIDAGNNRRTIRRVI